VKWKDKEATLLESVPVDITRDVESPRDREERRGVPEWRLLSENDEK